MRTGLEPGMSYSTTEGRETAESIRTLGGATPTLLLADLAGTMERTARKWLTDFCEGDEQSVGLTQTSRRGDRHCDVAQPSHLGSPSSPNARQPAEPGAQNMHPSMQ